MVDFFGNLFPNYANVGLLMFAMYVVAGIMGALVRVSWLDKPMRGFYRDKRGGVHMGFYGEIIVGIAVAVMVDGHPIRAGIAAVFAPWILDSIKVVLIEKLPQMLKAALETALKK